MLSDRFVVTELRGWLQAGPSPHRPGVSYQVIDTRWAHALVASFRSEHRRDGATKARAEAEQLAADLNAEVAAGE